MSQDAQKYSSVLNLFAAHRLTLAQAAKLADVPMETFMTLLGEAGIDVIDYPPEINVGQSKLYFFFQDTFSNIRITKRFLRSNHNPK